jgi:hypothetical protein
MDGPRPLLRPPRNRWPPNHRENAEDCRSGSDKSKSPRANQESRSTESIIEHRGGPARVTSSRSSGEAFGVFSHEVESTNPEHRHTTNPPGPCLSRTILIHKVGKVPGGSVGVTPAGPPAADFGTASPCGGRPYGGPAGCVRAGRRGDSLTKKADQISLLLDRECRGNWPRTPTPISSSCFLRRTWRTSAAFLAARSTAPLPEESFGRRGYATASESGPRSWSAGSAHRCLRQNARPRPRGRGLHGKPRVAACAPCSTRRATDRRRLR